MKFSKIPLTEQKKIDKENLKKIARKARYEGFIKIIDLASIMAREKVYTDVLPKLREEFLFEPRKRDMGVEGIWVFPSNSTLGTTKGNYDYWMNLLQRWARLRCETVKESQEPIRYLDYYQFDKLTEKYTIINHEETNLDHYFDHFISLNDFRNYLKYIEEIYAVYLPLPVQLFPESNGENITGEAIAESERQEELPNERYLFRNDGPSWTIRYEGKTLSGFTGKGFEIIHYLICKKGQVFHISELAKEIDKIDLDESKKLSEIDSEKERDEGNKKKAKNQLIDGKDMICGESKKDIKEHFYYLKNELREAENNHDPGRKEKVDKELTEFTKYMNSYFKKGGKSREFADDITRAKGRLSKRIERALKSIKKQDEKMYRHFHSALRPVNSFLQSYTPDRDIGWLT
jgi:hypothetical protein